MILPQIVLTHFFSSTESSEVHSLQSCTPECFGNRAGKITFPSISNNTRSSNPHYSWRHVHTSLRLFTCFWPLCSTALYSCCTEDFVCMEMSTMLLQGGRGWGVWWQGPSVERRQPNVKPWRLRKSRKKVGGRENLLLQLWGQRSGWFGKPCIAEPTKTTHGTQQFNWTVNC